MRKKIVTQTTTNALKTAVPPQPLRLLLALPPEETQAVSDALFPLKQSGRLILDTAELRTLPARLRRAPQTHLLTLRLADWQAMPARQQDAIMGRISLLVLAQERQEAVVVGQTAVLLLPLSTYANDLSRVCTAVINGADMAASAVTCGLTERLYLPGSNAAIWPAPPVPPTPATTATPTTAVRQQLFFAGGDQVNIRPQQESQGDGGISQQLFISLGDQVNTRPTQSSAPPAAPRPMMSVESSLATAVVCPACAYANIPQANYCQNCRHPLTTPP